MNRFPFYPRYMGDYARKTSHLSQAEHGAYTLLLDWQYANRAPLPPTLRSRFRIARASSRSEKSATLSVIAQFFVEHEDGLWNPRVKSELYEMDRRRNAKSEAGKKGAQKRWHSHSFANGKRDGKPIARARVPQPQKETDTPGSGLPVVNSRARARGNGSSLTAEQADEAERLQAELEQRRDAAGVEAPRARHVADVASATEPRNPGNPEPSED